MGKHSKDIDLGEKNDITQSINKRTVKMITFAAFASISVYSIVVHLPGILINEVVEAFSLEGADEGLMGTLTSLGFVVSIFFVLLIQGRAKKSTVLALALLSQAITLFICGVAPVLYLFFAGCVLVGFSGGFIDILCNSSIVDVRKQESTKYLGYLHGLFGIGSLLSPIIFFRLLRYIDWRGVFFAVAVASTLAALLVFFLTRGLKTVGNRETNHERLFTRADLLSFFRSKRSMILAFAGFFAMFAIACTMIWIVRYMTLSHDAAQLGVLSITIYWISATANRFLLAAVVKRAPMMFFALGAALSALLLLIGVFSGNPVFLCVTIGAFGFCSGHFVPVLVSEITVGYEGRTTFITSTLMFSMGIGRIIAPVLIALISTQISLTVGMMLPVAAAFIAMVFGGVAMKIKPTRGEAP